MKPLVLLDVDGVVNSLLASSPVRLVSQGFSIRWPDYMPALIRLLVENCEVWWCSTWRDRANQDIGPALGIPALPAVDDGTNSRYVDWKAPSAKPLVEQALADGRLVAWFEDFNGRIPRGEPWDSVYMVDTALTGYTLTEDQVWDFMALVIEREMD